MPTPGLPCLSEFCTINGPNQWRRFADTPPWLPFSGFQVTHKPSERNDFLIDPDFSGHPFAGDDSGASMHGFVGIITAFIKSEVLSP